MISKLQEITHNSLSEIATRDKGVFGLICQLSKEGKDTNNNYTIGLCVKNMKSCDGNPCFY